MAESMPLAAVGAPFQSLVRRAARQRGRITIFDQDEPSAVVSRPTNSRISRTHSLLPSHGCVSPPAGPSGFPMRRSGVALASIGDIHDHLGTRRC